MHSTTRNLVGGKSCRV